MNPSFYAFPQFVLPSSSPVMWQLFHLLLSFVFCIPPSSPKNGRAKRNQELCRLRGPGAIERDWLGLGGLRRAEAGPEGEAEGNDGETEPLSERKAVREGDA